MSKKIRYDYLNDVYDRDEFIKKLIFLVKHTKFEDTTVDKLMSTFKEQKRVSKKYKELICKCTIFVCNGEILGYNFIKNIKDCFNTRDDYKLMEVLRYIYKHHSGNETRYYRKRYKILVL